MKIKTIIKQTYELIGKECKKVGFYVNLSDFQNTVDIASGDFPVTSHFVKGDAILTLIDLTKEERRYKMTCQLSYTSLGNTPEPSRKPIRIGMAIQSAEDEARVKDLEKMVENSRRLIVEIEQRREV